MICICIVLKSLWGLCLWVFLYSIVHLFLYLLCCHMDLPSSSSFLIIPRVGDTCMSPWPPHHHSLHNAPPRRLLSPCPQGSGSPVSSAASPPGSGAPWSPPGHRCYPGTTWVTGTTPSRRRLSPRRACWSSPYWSSAVLSGCWPYRAITAEPHSDSDLEEEWQEGLSAIHKMGFKKTRCTPDKHSSI